MELLEKATENTDFVYSELEKAFNSAPLESCPIELIYRFVVSCLSESVKLNES